MSPGARTTSAARAGGTLAAVPAKARKEADKKYLIMLVVGEKNKAANPGILSSATAGRLSSAERSLI
jgi:hypothetical protein